MFHPWAIIPKSGLNSFSYALPGSMYEVSPDFGMIAQGWNIYAVAVPIVDHFFGVQPMAHEKIIRISPNMPDNWTNVTLSDIKINGFQNTVSTLIHHHVKSFVFRAEINLWHT